MPFWNFFSCQKIKKIWISIDSNNRRKRRFDDGDYKYFVLGWGRTRVVIASLKIGVDSMKAMNKFKNHHKSIFRRIPNRRIASPDPTLGLKWPIKCRLIYTLTILIDASTLNSYQNQSKIKNFVGIFCKTLKKTPYFLSKNQIYSPYFQKLRFFENTDKVLWKIQILKIYEKVMDLIDQRENFKTVQWR